MPVETPIGLLILVFLAKGVLSLSLVFLMLEQFLCMVVMLSVSLLDHEDITLMSMSQPVRF